MREMEDKSRKRYDGGFKRRIFWESNKKYRLHFT